MAQTVVPAFVTFRDTDGEPLENGSVYIGTAGLDPVTNPIAVYWDNARTIPAEQPIKTSAGYFVNNGSFAAVYVATDYSITVLNKNNVLVTSSLTSNALLENEMIELIETEVAEATGGSVAAIQAELDATQVGAGLGGDGAYSAPTGTNYLGSTTSLKNADSTLDAQIKINADGISTNAGNISTNASGISTNAGDIGTNASNIAINASNISTNSATISANGSDISTNTNNITQINNQLLNTMYVGASASGNGSGSDASNRMAIGTLFASTGLINPSDILTVYTNTTTVPQIVISGKQTVCLIYEGSQTQLTVTGDLTINGSALYVGYGLDRVSDPSNAHNITVNGRCDVVAQGHLAVKDNLSVTGILYGYEGSYNVDGNITAQNDFILNINASVFCNGNISHSGTGGMSISNSSSVLSATATLTNTGSKGILIGSKLVTSGSVTSSGSTLALQTGSFAYGSTGWTHTGNLSVSGKSLFGNGVSTTVSGTVTRDSGGATNLTSGYDDTPT